MRNFWLLIAVACAAAEQTSPTAPKGIISGVVTDTAGAPLADVDVFANCNTAKRVAAVTDSQGRFALKELEPGECRVSAAAPLGANRGFGPSTFRMVTLGAGQELKVDLRLELFGEITGKVLDENKEPVPNTAVILVMREYVLGALRYRYGAMGRTDDRGVYTLQRVFPGRSYVVMAGHRLNRLEAISEVPEDPKMRKRVPVRTYFPDSTTADGGELLVLRPGERREGVDVRLRKSQSYCFDGVLDADGKPGVLNFELIEPGPSSGLNAGGGMYIISPIGRTAADGKIRVCDLYPGTYQVRVSQAPAGDADTPAFLGTAEVTIKDQDVHNVRIAARPKMVVSGEVVWDGPAPEKAVEANLSVSLHPMTRAPWRGEDSGLSAKASIPGEFTLAGLFMDEYQVTLRGLPAGLYVKDVTYGTASVLHEPLKAGSGLGGRLRVIVGQDGGAVGVKVADKDGNAVPDINVYLVPADAASEAMVQALMVRGQTGQGGSYKSGVLAPGKYYVLASSVKIDATPESIGKLWRSRLRGKEVELNSKGSAQVTVEPVTIE